MRNDNRENNELRPIEIIVNPIGPNSCIWSQGGTQAIVNISIHKHLKQIDDELRSESSVKYRYSMCSFSCNELVTGKAYTQKRSIEISKVSAHIFENVILLNEYNRDKFYICADLILAEAGTRVTAINAATIALILAGISMLGYVSAISFGKYNDEIILDLNDEEDKEGNADCAITFLNPFEEILMVQMEGYLTKDEFFKGLDLALEGNKKIYEIQKRIIDINAKQI